MSSNDAMAMCAYVCEEALIRPGRPDEAQQLALKLLSQAHACRACICFMGSHFRFHA